MENENTIKQAEAQQPVFFDFTEAGDFCMPVTETDARLPVFCVGDVAIIRHEALHPRHERSAAVVICKDGRAMMGQMATMESGEHLLVLPGVGLIPFETADFLGPVVALWRSLEPTTNEGAL